MLDECSAVISNPDTNECCVIWDATMTMEILWHIGKDGSMTRKSLTQSK